MVPRALSSISTGLTLVNTPSSASRQASTLSTIKSPERPKDAVKAINDVVTQTNGATNSKKTDLIWRAVLADHTKQLKPKDQLQCVPLALNASVDEAAIEAIFAPLRRKLEKDIFYRTLRRVNPIAEHVLSFGKAFDVAMGSGGPLAAGLVWGSIRILLAVRHLYAPVDTARPKQMLYEKLSPVTGLGSHHVSGSKGARSS